MSKVRKLLSLALAVMLVMSLATTAFADDTYTLTLNGAQAGHTYTAYQIFAGDLSGNTLSNIVWGNGVLAAGQSALGDASTKAESLSTTADAEAFAAEVAPYLATAAGSVTIADGAATGTITGLTAGYYLVQTTATSTTNGVYTFFIMKVVKDTSATIKADVPKIDKTVDKNDVSIGDKVTFTLTATMPSNLQGYETYKLVFHDTLSAGLDFVEGSVKVNGTSIASSAVTETNGALTITIADAKVAPANATAGSTVTVTYEAVLDSDAVIGSEGNLNEVYLEYSNNPNWNGQGNEPTGETPKDDVKVYTWEIPVFKYTKGDGDAKTPLAGAGFELYSGNTQIKFTDAGNNVYKVDPAGDVTEITTGSTGKFEIEGLAQGEYVLKEKTVPAGYNKCDDVTVAIGENGVLTVDNSTVTTVEILNQAGSTLPETGGIGTTMFYVIGGVLVLAAVVLLVTKKRMAAAE